MSKRDCLSLVLLTLSRSAPAAATYSQQARTPSAPSQWQGKESCAPIGG